MEEFNLSFNAPQYVDFSAPQLIDDDADKWFDTHDDGKPLKDRICEDESMKENVFEDPQIPVETEKKEEKPSNEDVSEKKKRPANILTPSRWYRNKSANEDKKTSLQQNLASKLASKPAKSNNKPMKAFPMTSPKTNDTSKKMVRGNSMTNINGSVTSSGEKGTLKKSLSSSKLKRSSSLRSASTRSEQDLPGRVLRPRGSSTDRLENQTSNKDSKETMTPTTRTCMKRKHTSVGPSRVIKNSEESELETIERFRKPLVEKRKQLEQSDLSLKKIKATSNTGPMKAKVDESNTSSKGKSKTKAFLENIKDKFTSSGKEQNPQEKSRKDLANDKFESMAERVLKFQSGTPDRFRSRPKDNCKMLKPLRSGSPRNMKSTIPHTPNLQSTKRTRKVHAPSREELELKEIEEMQKNQFHAQPVNHKILEHRTGVKEVPKKPTTEVKSFDLSSNKRVKDKEDKKPKEEKYSFHAKPVNPKILEGQTGVKPAKEKPTTVPQSPAFALKNRVRLPVSSSEEKEIVRVLRSRPIPHNGVPFQPNLSHKRTIPQPFSFEEQMHQIQERHEAKRRKIFEEERQAREFHAQPMPILEERIGIPPKQTKESTIPVPFEFEIDGRSFRKGDEASNVSDEDVVPHFKAKPATVIYQKAFKPKKSEKPTTDISEFELNTEKRAAERESFEMHMKHKEAQMLALKRQKEQEEEDAAKAEEQRLRMESVHKAKPVRHYAPVNICPSEKPLTRPESPMFTDRFKV